MVSKNIFIVFFQNLLQWDINKMIKRKEKWIVNMVYVPDASLSLFWEHFKKPILKLKKNELTLNIFSFNPVQGRPHIKANT